jgi:8-amino-7-oxononanoate synthase
VPVLDFTSALYLGFRHGTYELRPWTQFTTGRPAALGSPQLALQLGRQVAALQGCERALVATSTLHLFWDLLPVIAGRRAAIFLDDGTYPIARWGVERAAALGIPVRTFPHHNALSLRHAFMSARTDRSPLIVADGFCPACGRCAPVAEYLALARQYGGYLVLDDTQALGILGCSASPEAPYGKGGGGVLRMINLGGPEVVLVSSLAKAFGVPIAVLSGPANVVERYESESETRMHCSPPSVAALNAAEHALQLNRQRGDTLRQHLAVLVRHFQSLLEAAGLTHTSSVFPVQTTLGSGPDSAVVYQRLLRAGVRAVLHQAHGLPGPQLSFLITARHTFSQLQTAVDMFSRAVGLVSPESIGR